MPNDRALINKNRFKNSLSSVRSSDLKVTKHVNQCCKTLKKNCK